MTTLSHCRILSNSNQIGLGACNRNASFQASISPAVIPTSDQGSVSAYSPSQCQEQYMPPYELHQDQLIPAPRLRQTKPCPDICQPLYVDTSVEYEISGKARPPPNAGYCLLMVHPLYHEFLRHWRLQRGSCRCRVCIFYGCRTQVPAAESSSPERGSTSRQHSVQILQAGSAVPGVWEHHAVPGAREHHAVPGVREHHAVLAGPANLRYDTVSCSGGQGWTLAQPHAVNNSQQPLLHSNEVWRKQVHQQPLQKQQQLSQRQQQLLQKRQQLQKQQLETHHNLQIQQRQLQKRQHQQLDYYQRLQQEHHLQQQFLTYTCVLPNTSSDSADSGYSSVEPYPSSVFVDSGFLQTIGRKRPRCQVDPQLNRRIADSTTFVAGDSGYYLKRHCSSLYQQGVQCVPHR